MKKELTIREAVILYGFLETNFDTNLLFMQISNRLSYYDVPFNGSMSMKISLIKKKLKELIEPVLETRDKLIREDYGVEKEDGNISVPQEKLKDFVKEIDEMLNEKTEIQFMPFKFEEFEKITECPTNVTDMLVFFMEE